MTKRTERILDEMASAAMSMTDAELIESNELEKKIMAKFDRMARQEDDPLTDKEETLIAIVCHAVYEELVIKPKRMKK